MKLKIKTTLKITDKIETELNKAAFKIIDRIKVKLINKTSSELVEKASIIHIKINKKIFYT